MAQEGAMADEEDETIATQLWNKFKNQESVFANYSPFIVCLASGTLHPDVFLHCIGQDTHILNAFLNALRMAVECTDDKKEKIAIRAVWKSVNERRKSYQIRVSEWGFELTIQQFSWGTTVTYTEFLMTVPGEIVLPYAKQNHAAYYLAAMAPWMRLYASVSKEINGLPDAHENSHMYSKWVDDYCSRDFEAFTLQIEDLLEKLSISLNYDELEVVESLYLRAMQFGVEHFATQLVAQRSVLPVSLLRDPADSRLLMFCDFETACSNVSTSNILGKIAMETAAKVGAHGPDFQQTRMSSADPKSIWDTLLAQHAEERNQFLDSIFARKTAEIFNYEGVCKALEQAAGIQKMTNSKIIEDGSLKGLSLEDIKRAGKRLCLLEGCKEFFQEIVKSAKLKSNVHVISYCWCGDLIRSAVSSGDPNVLDALTVHSNELAYERSVSTGEITRIVESPAEKLQIFCNFFKDFGANTKQLTVYVGGSESDLLCLLKADIGIVMGSSCPSLRKLGNHFGISFVPLFSGVIKRQKELAAGASPVWKGLQGILYTASSWAEIHAFILGL